MARFRHFGVLIDGRLYIMNKNESCLNTNLLHHTHVMDPHAIYGPFRMKAHSVLNNPAEQCNVFIECAGIRLCRARETMVINNTTDIIERVLVFPLAECHEGQRVHIKLVNILNVGSAAHEWPKDKMVITAKRTTDGVEQGIEEREISGHEHTLSSLYVRGAEVITIQCKFSGDAMPKNTIVHVDLRLCKNGNARIITAGGGGAPPGPFRGGGAPPGPFRGGGGGGKGKEANSEWGDEKGAMCGGGGSKRSSRYPVDVEMLKRGPGYDRDHRNREKGPNCPDAVPDDEEMNQVLVALAMSQQEKAQFDISRLPCPVCKEEAEKRKCCVCFINDTRVIFKPCHHIVCCRECANKPAMKTCPVCRTFITERAVAFGNV